MDSRPPLGDPFGGGDPLTAPLVQPLPDASADPRRTTTPWSAVTGPNIPGPNTPVRPSSHATWHGPAFQAGGPSWPPPDVANVPAPHPPTYDTSAAPPPIYGGSPAFLPGHPTAAQSSPPTAVGTPPASRNVTEPIPNGSGWGAPTARGTARARRPGAIAVTLGDVLMILGGALLLVFSALPFVSYTDERFVAVESRNDLPTSWTAWSPNTFLAPLSWVAIVAAGLVAVLGVLRVLNRGHRALFGLPVGQVRVLLAGLSLLILLSFAVSSKTVLFGDDRPQLTDAGMMIDSTLSLERGGYLMLLAALTLFVGAAVTAQGTGGPVIWPLPDVVRTMVAKRTPPDGPGSTPNQAHWADPRSAPPVVQRPGSAPPGAYYPPPGYPPQR